MHAQVVQTVQYVFTLSNRQAWSAISNVCCQASLHVYILAGKRGFQTLVGKSKSGHGLSWAKPFLKALARPRILESPSQVRPGQSHSFQARLDQNTTSFDPFFLNLVFSRLRPLSYYVTIKALLPILMTLIPTCA